MTYAPILMVFAFAALVAGALLFIPTLIAPRRLSPVKSAPFECGKDPIAVTEGRFAIKFSLIAILFIIIDIELLFIWPWATLFRQLGWFGFGLPRFSPRQADVLFVVGTISHKMAPVLKRIYDQMTEPKWVVAFGVCTCTGGFYDNYATVQGIDTIIPVDVYIPGCPPRPESVIDGLMKLQDKIAVQAQRY